MSALVELLKKATIQVCLRTGKHLGTAFRISDGLVLTAAHVLGRYEYDQLELVGFDGTRISEPHVYLQLPTERPTGNQVWPPPDLALFSVESRAPATWQIASVSDQVPSSRLVAVGYVPGIYDLITVDPVALELEGTRTESSTMILKLSGSRLNPGMSGAPVLDLESGLVIGYVKADRGTEGGAFVISLTSLKQHVPQAWGAALAASSRNAIWNTTRRLGIPTSLDSTLVEDYLTAVSAIFTRGSALLPTGVDREQLRQPIRLRQITAETFVTMQPSSLGTNLNDSDDPESFIWDPRRSPWQMVGIVASPGMGKSWLLAFHTRTVAAVSLQTLTANVLAETKIPVLVEATSYARLLPPSPNREDATVALAQATHRTIEGQVPEKDCELLVSSALLNRRLVLCVDGLDEVSMDLRPRLATALSLLGPQVDQLIVSARDSARQVLQELFPRGYSEFRIEGFTIGDARRFVQVWHRGNPGAVEAVGADLRTFPHLRSLARVPLLLGFICRLATKGEAQLLQSLPSTRPSLYRDVALGLLSGRWRESSARRADTESSDPFVRLRLLSEAVGQLGTGWRQRPDVFYRSDLQAILRTLKGYAVVASAAESRWRSWQAAVQAPAANAPEDFVIWEYEYDGLLIPSIVRNRPALRFIHQVFAELCLALNVGKAENDSIGAIVDDHRWFDDEWADVFPVACGMEEESSRVLKSLIAPKADPWLTQCELESRCIAERADPASVDRNQLASLLARLSEGVRGALQTDSQAAARSLERLVDARLRSAIAVVEDLVSNVPPLAHELRLKLIFALTRAGSEKGIDEAIAVVEGKAVAAEELLFAIDALARSNSHRAVDFLAKRLGMSDEKGRVPLAVALAHGDELATDTAVSLARRSDIPMALRTDIIVALIESGVGEEAALDLVLDLEVSWVLKCRAMVALLRVGAPVSEQDVEALVHDPNVPNRERIELVRALLLRGDIAMLNIAAELIVQVDIDFSARFDLARTMVSISDLGVDVVRRVATDPALRATARLQSLRVLVERHDASGISEAARLLMSNDEPTWLRVILFEQVLEKSPAVLSNADLTLLLDALDADPRNHSRERSIGILIGCADRVIARYGKERFHDAFATTCDSAQRLPDHDALITQVARAGEVGVGLLLSLALAPEQPIGTRVKAALAAAQSDPRQAEALGEFLEDPTVPEPVRTRLTVALGMLGCQAAFHRLIALLPNSEPAYTALGALLSSPSSTREMVRLGLLAATAAQAHLKQEGPPVWSVDFGEEVQSLGLPGDSEAERDLRFEWARNRLRQRVDERLLALLIPVERAALYRAGKMQDGPETRNWLARWIPEYREIISNELQLLREELAGNPSLLPSVAESGTTLGMIAQVSRLLDEWVGASFRNDWNSVASILSSYKDTIASDLSQALLSIAAQIDDSWPLHSAYQYLAYRASEDEVDEVLQEIYESKRQLDSIRVYLDGQEGSLALGAAGLAVLMHPDSAAAWFYAGVAALLLEQRDFAATMMTKSAANASPVQAVQGRRTLAQYGVRWSSSEGIVDRLRDILGSVPGALDLEASTATSALPEYDPEHVDRPGNSGSTGGSISDETS